MSKTVTLNISDEQESELISNIAGCDTLADVIEKLLPYNSRKPDVLKSQQDHQALLSIIRTYSPESMARTVVYALKTSEKQAFIDALLRYQNGTYNM